MNSLKHVAVKGRIISFIGVDGTGKTTYAKWLLQELHNRGKKVIYFHVYSSDATALAACIDKSATDDIINMLSEYSRKSFVGAIVRAILIVVNSWLTLLILKLRYRELYIIYDRYFYDSVVVVAAKVRKFPRLILTLSKLVIKPDIVFLLKARPETTMRRKSEGSINSIKKLCTFYDALELILPIVTPVVTEVNMEAVKREIIERVICYRG